MRSLTKIEEADLLNSQNELEKAYGIYKDILGENPGTLTPYSA